MLDSSLQKEGSSIKEFCLSILKDIGGFLHISSKGI